MKCGSSHCSVLKSFDRLCAKIGSRPGRALGIFCIAYAFLWALQNAVFRGTISNDSVETVCWGARLQLGYFKHPPLSAWIGYFAAYITNCSDFIQYFLDTACISIGAWFVYKLAKEFFSERLAAFSALVLFFTHYYIVPPIVFCPNSIMTAMLPVMAYCFRRSVKDDRIGSWLLFGLISGLAFLGKYSAGILLFSMFIGMLFHKEAREKMLRPGPYLAAIVFFLVILPHLYWLYQNDFICLKYVDNSVGKAEFPPFLYALFILLTGLYPFLLAAAVLLAGCLPFFFKYRKGILSREALYWGLFFSLPPILLYTGFVLSGKHVVAMWLSTVFSFTGMTVVSVFPFYLSGKAFGRLFICLCLIFTGVLIGTGIDFMIRAKFRIHVSRTELQNKLDEFMKRSGENRKACFVIGYRNLVNRLEYYHKDHPVSIDSTDPLMTKKFAPEILKKGGVVFERNEEMLRATVDNFRKDFPYKSERVMFTAKSIFGKEDHFYCFAVFLPPETK